MFPVIALAVAAASPLATAADRLLADYGAAWGRADAVQLAALYTADGELVSPAGSATGRAAIAQLYGGGFANGMAATVLTAQVESVRPIALGVAFGRGTWRLAPRGGTAAAFCGRFFTVLRRDGSAWRMAAFAEVELACGEATP